MTLEIRPLTADLTEDYLWFFDNVAFTDNEEWAGCYCVFYYLVDAADTLDCEEGICYRRDLAVRYIREGKLRGYLAYVDGVVAAWCNAGDKGSFERLSRESYPALWDASDETAKIKSVVCFTIAPERRHQGLATALLERACADAFAEGYTVVEAYPTKGETTSRSYRGPVPLLEKAGFSVYKDLGDALMMRKRL